MRVASVRLIRPADHGFGVDEPPGVVTTAGNHEDGVSFAVKLAAAIAIADGRVFIWFDQEMPRALLADWA